MSPGNCLEISWKICLLGFVDTLLQEKVSATFTQIEFEQLAIRYVLTNFCNLFHKYVAKVKYTVIHN